MLRKCIEKLLTFVLSAVIGAVIGICVLVLLYGMWRLWYVIYR